MSDDERYCQDLTRREAKNFYWGFIALPRQQRLGIYALYSFARQVDDAIDLAPAWIPGQDCEQLTRHRTRVEHCFSDRADDPVMRVLSQVVREYGIPPQELESLIEGVEMDVRQCRYASWDELRVYCGHVAGTVGRMCVRIFGFTSPDALVSADDLGVAMQLANILRDVREDAEHGRIYLPQDDLHFFGVSESALMGGDPGAGWERLMSYEIKRARDLFDSGLQVTRMIPRRAAACVFTMAGIYRTILEDIAQDPYLPLTRRASLSSREKISVMLKSWLQAI
ncbi:MAG TPA: squalene/phytoene synthase family protein [Chloroflexota bacterium]